MPSIGSTRLGLLAIFSAVAQHHVSATTAASQQPRLVPDGFAAVGSRGVEGGGRTAQRHETVPVSEVVAAAAAAASTVAKVAAALAPERLPPGVREAALEAASEAAARAALSERGRPVANDAADPEGLQFGAGEQGQSQRRAGVDLAMTEDEAVPRTPMMRRHPTSWPAAPPVASTSDDAAPPSPVTTPSMDRVQSDAASPDVSSPDVSVLDRRVSADNRQAALDRSAGSGPQPLDRDGSQAKIGPEKLLYIGVFSTPRDFERRASARKGWIADLRRKFPDSAEVLAKFVIGRRPVKAYAGAQDGQSLTQSSLIEIAKEASTRPIELSSPWATTLPPLPLDTTLPMVDPQEVRLDMELGHEMQQEGDMLHIPYEDLPIRVLMFFAHAAATDYRFVLKVDVDHDFLFMPALRSLQQESSNTLLYAGQNLLGSGRDRRGRNVQPEEEEVGVLADEQPGKKDLSERYFAGPCYLASHTLARRIAKTHLDHSLMLWSYNAEGRPLPGSPLPAKGSDVDGMDMGQWVAWEDNLLADDKSSSHAHASASVTGVTYRPMDLCRLRVAGRSRVEEGDTAALDP